MRKNKTSNKASPKSKPYRIFLFLITFMLSLSLIYALWYPVASFYGIFRYWFSLKLIHLIGFYPHADNIRTAGSQGDFFSFLPFLALMISTYKGHIVNEWKYLLTIFLMIVGMEIIGKFFEQWYAVQPFYLAYVLSIFFLATARVAIPFLAWWVSIQENRIRLF